ncbi:TATA-binding protein-associated factor mot1 [Tulasnella sp. 427]|nr:TATA-binding protein-associated factor mot1 [Tulasnella sp. 427]
MSSRLDRLLLLLDTGASPAVRAAAAKQVAQIAAKSVSEEVPTDTTTGVDAPSASNVHVYHPPSSDWSQVMAVVSRLLPYLHSKSTDTRVAASSALQQICSLVPIWKPRTPPSTPRDGSSTSTSTAAEPPFPPFVLEDLLFSPNLLLASSGKEFAKPVQSDKDLAAARQEAMKRMGLGFFEDVSGDGFAKDLEKEFADDEDADVRMSDANKTDQEGSEPPTPAFVTVKMEVDVPTPPQSTEAHRELSKRELNRLKRKRKDGNAFVAAAPAAASRAHEVQPSPKVRVVDTDAGPSAKPASPGAENGNGVSVEKVVIDPQKGGQVTANDKPTKTITLDPKEGHWVWHRVVEVLEVDLVSPNWEVRHGAGLALRDIVKSQGACGGMIDGASAEENAYNHENWCNQLAAKFLLVFVLDRFSDFVSDQMVAPVRETVSQSLASLLLHMPRRSILRVHDILLQMILQTNIQPPTSNGHLTADAANGNMSKRKGKGKSVAVSTHVWQVRHAGLLGVKYEVAVRYDLVDVDQEGGRDVLKGVVEAALLGLADQDDDVRSIAASCLTPIVQQIVERLPEDVPAVMDVLWNCLSDMTDDLGSSVGAVMELLVLAPILFPFFRHTITTVRLAVVNTFVSFLNVPALVGPWISQQFVRLLFQNIIVEEKHEIRDASFAAWKASIDCLTQMPHDDDGTADVTMLGANGQPRTKSRLEMTVPEALLPWFTVLMNPIGVPLDSAQFYQPVNGPAFLHNVDKPMLTQDLSLVSEEWIMRGRVTACKAMAYAMAVWPVEKQHDAFHYFLTFYDVSRSMLQRFLSATIIQEWAIAADAKSTLEPPISLCQSSPLAAELAARLIKAIESPPPATYHEQFHDLAKLQKDCQSLVNAFHTEVQVSMPRIPTLPVELDFDGGDKTRFSAALAEETVTKKFDELKALVGKPKRKNWNNLNEKRKQLQVSLERYQKTKKSYDVRVMSAVAAAIVGLRNLPEKKNPIIHGIMDGTKYEENADLQERAALSVVDFVTYISSIPVTTKVNPAEKIVKNLCTFVCADESLTPIFAENTTKLNGIAQFKRHIPAARLRERNKPYRVEMPEDWLSPSKLQRRGALQALSSFGDRLGPNLFDRLPKLWECMSEGLFSTYSANLDLKERDEVESGQSVVDNLTVIQGIAPHLHQDLLNHITGIFPYILGALNSRYCVIRNCAARCFATLCDVFTAEAMHYVVDNVLPRLQAPTVYTRQGAMELISAIVHLLDLKTLPYVIFLIVPVLGRMSDPDTDIRFTATNTFASLVKMVPLEAGLPDPPGFSDELLQKKAEERLFLSQLLDGSKTVPYKIPVPINAELRKYQQEGVNWLAFLAKYQLHGVLCDDMGLGKTLQSICILASMHYERSEKWKETQAPDSSHRPSLIVCPPTLTGHWYHEILKYATNLRPIQYVGPARDRSKLLDSFSKYDVVITSYDVVRNDVTDLGKWDWHYCILDEGHVIKNPKTQLTKAVKAMKANHRLILSGTPIQNNVVELWSLFDFLMPGFLGTEANFNERFGKPILANRDGKGGAKGAEAAAAALDALHKQVLPFLLRRLKEDVLSDLPPKIIQDYYCELSDLQRALYDEYTQSQAQAAVAEAVKSGGKTGPGQTHVFQALQYLRKLCNHPALVVKSPDEIREVTAKRQITLGPKGLRDVVHAPKIEALRQILNDCGIGCQKDDETQDLVDGNGTFSRHRVLIFCQMKQMIEMIETDLFQALMPEVTYMRLDGTVDANKRHATVQTFNADPSIDCLLLTTHVGGLGLTLTGADTVIFVEHDWNPMKDLQAMDRAHRLGQKKVVNVYRLITKGTLEEKIMGLQRFKLNIANSVVTQQNAGLASMDTDLVLDLFRHTKDDEDAMAKQKRKEADSNKPTTAKNVLEGLEDIPNEDEYESLNFSAFMGSLGR